ncbi:hypothetical protein BDR04DRAFT_1091773 [Suillus decipiens]|nr:hypothetical protein BDR04DRAFT_1091773 [Suillus decipiens]
MPHGGREVHITSQFTQACRNNTPNMALEIMYQHHQRLDIQVAACLIPVCKPKSTFIQPRAFLLGLEFASRYLVHIIKGPARRRDQIPIIFVVPILALEALNDGISSTNTRP